jgi:hypothetical protein
VEFWWRTVAFWLLYVAFYTVCSNSKWKWNTEKEYPLTCTIGSLLTFRLLHYMWRFEG